MTQVEPDGRAVRPVDSLLDEIFHLYEARDDAVQALCRIILDNPQMDGALSAVVLRLEATR